MAKEECPYCGEPIDAEATFCKHCGSDAETGWNPDSDYESLELPEEEEEAPAKAGRDYARAQLRKLLGPALVVSSWFFFVVLASTHLSRPGLVAIPATYLAVVILIVSRLAARGDERRARRPVRR